MQLAGTMGFVLGKRGGKFMGLNAAEMTAVHDGWRWDGGAPPHWLLWSFKSLAIRRQEILTWGPYMA